MGVGRFAEGTAKIESFVILIYRAKINDSVLLLLSSDNHMGGYSQTPREIYIIIYNVLHIA